LYGATRSLKNNVQTRKAELAVTDRKQVNPVPAGYSTVTPWIISRDTAGLIAFLKAAFDATELARVQMEDGTIGHAEARIGDSVVMMFDARPAWPKTPAFLRLYVPDGDAIFQQALRTGATAVTEMTEMAWGDRVGRVRDPFGNLWWIQTRITHLTPEEMGHRAAEPRFIEAMAYVMSAQFFPPESEQTS
jgi:PhnB protein